MFPSNISSYTAFLCVEIKERFLKSGTSILNLKKKHFYTISRVWFIMAKHAWSFISTLSTLYLVCSHAGTIKKKNLNIFCPFSRDRHEDPPKCDASDPIHAILIVLYFIKSVHENVSSGDEKGYSSLARIQEFYNTIRGGVRRVNLIFFTRSFYLIIQIYITIFYKF